MTQQVRFKLCIYKLTTLLIVYTFTVAGKDFVGLVQRFTINQMNPSFVKNINILDNEIKDGRRRFFFRVKGGCGLDEWVEICIWDDESSMFSLTLALNHSEDDSNTACSSFTTESLYPCNKANYHGW